MTFPVNGIIDDFNRGAEGPPPSANWATGMFAGFGYGPSYGLKVDSNEALVNTADGGGAMRTSDTYGPDIEVYATLVNIPSSANNAAIYWSALDPAVYDNLFEAVFSIFPVADHYDMYCVVSRAVGGAWSSVIGSTDEVTIAAGDKIGISHVGDTVTVWFKSGSSAWASIGSGTNDTQVVGYIGVLVGWATGRIDDFGGGTISAPVAPTADFSGTPTSGAATLDVDFTDLSTGTPTSWSWDFGDGDTSTSQNPSHSYPFIGVYTVALTATNAIGDDTETKVDYIVVGVAPAADFSGTPTSGDAPLSVDFTDASTGDVTDWLWDFGDGGSDVIPNATHVYAAAGTYTVALTVTGPAGTDTETKVDYITVTAAAAPVADFSGDTTSGTAPLTVNFTDASTNTPTSWLWLFGDGASDTAQNPTHIYAYVGTYTVTLTATNAAGSDDEVKVAYITVTAVVEYGAAVVENCDIDTGGLAVGLRVADVAIARDNRIGSVVIDASAELRVKDNSYTTLTNSGTFTSLAGDRSVWDVANFPNAHASDIDGATWVYHLKSAASQVYTISNPATDRAYDVTATTLNEIAAVLGTLIGDLQAKGILG